MHLPLNLRPVLPPRPRRSRLQPQDARNASLFFDFDYATVKTGTAALFGTDIDVGKGISDLLVKNLVTDGTYSVIERKQLDKILGEQNFSNSNRADPTSAAKIRKILGLDAIIVGSITELGNETKNRKIGGGGGGFGGFGIGGIGHKETKANVVLDARLVDVDTAEILGVAEGKGESKRSCNSLLGGGGTWGGFGGGAVDFGSSNFQQTIIGEATKAAVDQMTAGVIAAAPKLQARVIKVEGVLAAVDGGQIVLNIGAKTGIKVGDHLSVERVTSTIKDSTTGAVLRRMTTKLGEHRVTDVVDEHFRGLRGPYQATDLKLAMLLGQSLSKAEHVGRNLILFSVCRETCRAQNHAAAIWRRKTDC